MQRNSGIVWILLIAAASGCTEAATVETDRPREQQISSRVSLGPDGDILIAVRHSGGGAGDTTYRLLACPAEASSCEVLANIDSGSGPKPELAVANARLALTINRSDGIWDFRNFSRSFPSGGVAINISYR